MFKVGKNITVNADRVLEFRGTNDAGEELAERFAFIVAFQIGPVGGLQLAALYHLQTFPVGEGAKGLLIAHDVNGKVGRGRFFLACRLGGLSFFPNEPPGEEHEKDADDAGVAKANEVDGGGIQRGGDQAEQNGDRGFHWAGRASANSNGANGGGI